MTNALPLEDLASALVERARTAGADAADVLVYEARSLSSGCRLGALEEVERSEGRDLGLRVFVGKRQAIVSSNDLSEKGLAPLAERAVAMARLAPEDPYCGLAPAERLAKDLPGLDMEDAAEPSADSLGDMATACEDAGRSVEGITNSNGASAGWSRGRLVLATSDGFAKGYGWSSYSVSCAMIASGEEGMETDYEFSSARHFADLREPDWVGREAGNRAARRLGPRKVSTRQVPVVFEPRIAKSLLGHLAGAISGTSVARGTSFLKDKMGEQIFAPGITIIDDPLRPRGQGSEPFDGEGVQSEPLTLVENGVLNHWLLNSSAARQLGLQTNGRATRGTSGPPGCGTTNLYLAAGDQSPEDLMADIKDGLYVTTVFGQGVNGVTGDYSRGAAGLWIENGVPAYPVSEVTIAGNLKDMFATMVAANDLELRTGRDAPTVRLEGLTLAGA